MRFLLFRYIFPTVIATQVSSSPDPVPAAQLKEHAPALPLRAPQKVPTAVGLIPPGTTQHVSRKFDGEDLDADVSVTTIADYENLRASMAIIPDNRNQPPMMIYPRGVVLLFAGIVVRSISVSRCFFGGRKLILV